MRGFRDLGLGADGCRFGAGASWHKCCSKCLGLTCRHELGNQFREKGLTLKDRIPPTKVSPRASKGEGTKVSPRASTGEGTLGRVSTVTPTQP